MTARDWTPPYELEVRTEDGVTHTLRPVWPAAYFVLVTDVDKGNRPLLIHCADVEHAARALQFGGTLLNSELEVVDRTGVWGPAQLQSVKP